MMGERTHERPGVNQLRLIDILVTRNVRLYSQSYVMKFVSRRLSRQPTTSKPERLTTSRQKCSGFRRDGGTVTYWLTIRPITRNTQIKNAQYLSKLN